MGDKLLTLEELKTFEEKFYIKRLERVSETPLATDEEIDEKYLKGEVRIVTEQARYPLPTISAMFTGDNYILMPEFQRRHRWPVEKQSKLIESFILNIPVPPIFLYEKNLSEYEVMDGLQRITAIKDFYEGKYALQGLDRWRELNGRTYATLPTQVRKGIDRRYISSIILLNESAKTEKIANEMKQLVFSRINSGGAKLEDQEYRNSQSSGPFKDMLIELARDSIFCTIFGIPQKTADEDLSKDIVSVALKNNSLFSKMKDVEIVLRFFAMRNIQAWSRGTLSNFLDNIAYESNSLPDQVIAKYRELFTKTIKLAYDIYGKETFKLWKKSPKDEIYIWKGQYNMVVYDPVMVSLSRLVDHADSLVVHKRNILERTKILFEEQEDMWNGRNTSKGDVEKRIGLFESMFRSFL